MAVECTTVSGAATRSNDGSGFDTMISDQREAQCATAYVQAKGRRASLALLRGRAAGVRQEEVSVLMLRTKVRIQHGGGLRKTHKVGISRSLYIPVKFDPLYAFEGLEDLEFQEVAEGRVGRRVLCCMEEEGKRL